MNIIRLRLTQLMALAETLLLLALLAGSNGARETLAAPHERVWLRIKSSPLVGSRFDWNEFSASRYQTLAQVLSERPLVANRQPGWPADAGELRLYRVEPIDLGQTVGELRLPTNGEKFYLTTGQDPIDG